MSQTVDVAGLANTDFGLPKIEEDVESNAGGIATYSVSKKKTTSIEHNGQVSTKVEVEEHYGSNSRQIGVDDVYEEEEKKQPDSRSYPHLPEEEQALNQARQRLIEATASISKGAATTIKTLNNPPAMIATLMIWFCNLFMK